MSAAGTAVAAAQLPTAEVRGSYDNAVGLSDAAIQGAVTSNLIENGPTRVAPRAASGSN